MPSVVGITATVATLSFAGVHSLWFLTALPIGVGLYAGFGSVNRRVENLKQQVSDDDGEIAEGLLVIGKIHSPGIVVLRESELELMPIVGERRIIVLSEVESIGEGRWLPGKWVWGKRAFTLRGSVWNPLAFAVPESIGARWSTILKARDSQ